MPITERPPHRIVRAVFPHYGSHLGCVTENRSLGQGWRTIGLGSQSFASCVNSMSRSSRGVVSALTSLTARATKLLGVVALVCQMLRRRGGIIRPPLTRAYSRERRFCAERCRCDYVNCIAGP